MPPLKLNSLAEARDYVEALEVPWVKLGVFDIDGILRGKMVSKAKFLSVLGKGLGFCDVVFGWDSNDRLYDNVKLTGWHTGYPDAGVRLIPESGRHLPLEGGVLFLGEFADKMEAICPRAMLRRVIAKVQEKGLEPLAAFEYEFFVFDETPHSVREKGFRNLKSWTPGNFGYSILRSSTHWEFHDELMRLGQSMNFAIEGLHTETGPGVLEAAIGVDGALAAADKAALFKTFSKVLAQRHDLMATFMAKWSKEQAGQSGHIHVSLKDKSGVSAFFDAKAPHKMSKTMREFTAGCQALMPELLALVAPTVNSYTRLTPGYWAPTNASWGVENRTCALRVVPGSPQSQRLEYRIAASDANPYLALSAVLLSGLYGLEHQLPLSEGVQGNAYDLVCEKSSTLPATLWEAAQRFKGSQVAREVLGDHFVDHFVATREWEEREFRRSVTDWELARYFEII